MANDPYDTPDDWYSTELVLFDQLINGNEDIGSDYRLQDLFDDALFNGFETLTPEERSDALDELRDYLWDEYGIDFDQEFDWESWREWYG